MNPVTKQSIISKWESMTPRERGALVVEKVMGWKLKQNGLGSMDGEYYWHDGNEFVDGRLANLEFSTDISASWEVVEQLNGEYSFSLRRLGDYFEGNPDYGWEAQFTSHEHNKAIAKTAPEAISLASLLAVMEV